MDKEMKTSTATMSMSDFTDRAPEGIDWTITSNQSVQFRTSKYRLTIGWDAQDSETEGWSWWMDRLEEYYHVHGGIEQHWESDGSGSLDRIDELDGLFAKME